MQSSLGWRNQKGYPLEKRYGLEIYRRQKNVQAAWPGDGRVLGRLAADCLLAGVVSVAIALANVEATMADSSPGGPQITLDRSDVETLILKQYGFQLSKLPDVDLRQLLRREATSPSIQPPPAATDSTTRALLPGLGQDGTTPAKSTDLGPSPQNSAMIAPPSPPGTPSLSRQPDGGAMQAGTEPSTEPKTRAPFSAELGDQEASVASQATLGAPDGGKGNPGLNTEGREQSRSREGSQSPGEAGSGDALESRQDQFYGGGVSPPSQRSASGRRESYPRTTTPPPQPLVDDRELGRKPPDDVTTIPPATWSMPDEAVLRSNPPSPSEPQGDTLDNVPERAPPAGPVWREALRVLQQAVAVVAVTLHEALGRRVGEAADARGLPGGLVALVVERGLTAGVVLAGALAAWAGLMAAVRKLGELLKETIRGAPQMRGRQPRAGGRQAAATGQPPGDGEWARGRQEPGWLRPSVAEPLAGLWGVRAPPLRDSATSTPPTGGQSRSQGQGLWEGRGGAGPEEVSQMPGEWGGARGAESRASIGQGWGQRQDAGEVQRGESSGAYVSQVGGQGATWGSYAREEDVYDQSQRVENRQVFDPYYDRYGEGYGMPRPYARQLEEPDWRRSLRYETPGQPPGSQDQRAGAQNGGPFGWLGRLMQSSQETAQSSQGTPQPTQQRTWERGDDVWQGGQPRQFGPRVSTWQDEGRDYGRDSGPWQEQRQWQGEEAWISGAQRRSAGAAPPQMQQGSAARPDSSAGLLWSRKPREPSQHTPEYPASLRPPGPQQNTAAMSPRGGGPPFTAVPQPNAARGGVAGGPAPTQDGDVDQNTPQPTSGNLQPRSDVGEVSGQAACAIPAGSAAEAGTSGAGSTATPKQAPRDDAASRAGANGVLTAGDPPFPLPISLQNGELSGGATAGGQPPGVSLSNGQFASGGAMASPVGPDQSADGAAPAQGKEAPDVVAESPTPTPKEKPHADGSTSGAIEGSNSLAPAESNAPLGDSSSAPRDAVPPIVGGSTPRSQADVGGDTWPPRDTGASQGMTPDKGEGLAEHNGGVEEGAGQPVSWRQRVPSPQVGRETMARGYYNGVGSELKLRVDGRAPAPAAGESTADVRGEAGVNLGQAEVVEAASAARQQRAVRGPPPQRGAGAGVGPTRGPQQAPARPYGYAGNSGANNDGGNPAAQQRYPQRGAQQVAVAPPPRYQYQYPAPAAPPSSPWNVPQSIPSDRYSPRSDGAGDPPRWWSALSGQSPGSSPSGPPYNPQWPRNFQSAAQPPGGGGRVLWRRRKPEGAALSSQPPQPSSGSPQSGVGNAPQASFPQMPAAPRPAGSSASASIWSRPQPDSSRGWGASPTERQYPQPGPWSAIPPQAGRSGMRGGQDSRSGSGQTPSGGAMQQAQPQGGLQGSPPQSRNTGQQRASSAPAGSPGGGRGAAGYGTPNQPVRVGGRPVGGGDATAGMAPSTTGSGRLWDGTSGRQGGADVSTQPPASAVGGRQIDSLSASRAASQQDVVGSMGARVQGLGSANAPSMPSPGSMRGSRQGQGQGGSSGVDSGAIRGRVEVGRVKGGQSADLLRQQAKFIKGTKYADPWYQ